MNFFQLEPGVMLRGFKGLPPDCRGPGSVYKHGIVVAYSRNVVDVRLNIPEVNAPGVRKRDPAISVVHLGLHAHDAFEEHVAVR